MPLEPLVKWLKGDLLGPYLTRIIDKVMYLKLESEPKTFTGQLAEYLKHVTQQNQFFNDDVDRSDTV